MVKTYQHDPETLKKIQKKCSECENLGICGGCGTFLLKEICPGCLDSGSPTIFDAEWETSQEKHRKRSEK